MALQSDFFQVTKKLITETASTNISLGRVIETTPEGTLQVAYPVNIFYNDVVYETDEQGNKLSVYEKKNEGAYQLSQLQAYQLFTTQVTLQDGTATYLGELIANLTDDILKDWKISTLITSQPSPVECIVDDTVKFTIGHQDTTLTYQWKENGIEIPNAITSVLTIPHAEASQNGNVYSVVLTLPYGSIESNPAILTVL